MQNETYFVHGVRSQDMGWQAPRLLGFGDVDWAKIFAALTAARYDYVISIEHEDRVFEGDEELVKRGFISLVTYSSLLSINSRRLALT